MRKRTVFGLIVLLIVGLTIFFGVRWFNKKRNDPYATFIKPRLELATFDIKTMNKQQTEMNMNMLIDNPAPIGFTAEKMQYTMFIEDVEVMKSTYPKTIKLEKNDSALITMPVTVNNAKLIKTLKNLEDRKLDSVVYRIKGKFYTDLLFLENKPIDFDIKKKGPVYRIPEVKMKKVKVDKLGLKNTKLIMTMEITNKNAFPFKFKDTFYKVSIDKDKLLKGQIDSAVNIPAKGKTELNIPVEVNIAEVGDTFFDMIIKPKEVDYSFYYETKLVSENRSVKDSKIVMEDQGKLKDLINQNK